MVQKHAKMGIAAMRTKKIHVKRPPPTLRARYKGTRARRVKRRTLEKFSLPAASAGRGAFLIAGYFGSCQLDRHIHGSLCASESPIGTYSRGSDSIILGGGCGCGGGWSLDELEVVGRL